MERIRVRLLCVVVPLLAAASSAVAGDRFGVGVKIGTLGYGAELTGRINDWVGIRGSLSEVNVTRGYHHTDVDYDAEVKLGAYGVLVDFHPFRGDFRLSA